MQADVGHESNDPTLHVLSCTLSNAECVSLAGWTIGFTDSSGLGLPYTYFNNWAYLSRVGVPPKTGTGPNATFPILIGEFAALFNSSLNATVDEFNNLQVSPE